MKRRNLFSALGICLIVPSLAMSHYHLDPKEMVIPENDKDIFVTIGTDALDSSYKTVGHKAMELKSQEDGIALLKVKESALPYISNMMHESFQRCAGYLRHESLEEASLELKNIKNRSMGSKAIFADYSINQQSIVDRLIPQVKSENILQTITELSKFRNRYYKSKYGVESSEWIAKKWQSLAKGRSDVNVELYNHPSFPQKSIVMTVKGKSDEVIIIGGHADSVSGMFRRENTRAPGSDDNASGIATMTEMIRVLMDNSYVPEKTLKFMGYAAEEVGLLGSQAIAKEYRAKGISVIGVMQLDMTNFKGSDLDIVMMTDYTNQEQNAFLGRLIDTYLTKVRWGYDKCGYGCSDHASWTNQGYPASMPFESRMGDKNRKIHTPQDTIKVSRGNAKHAAKFARMGLAFAVELDR